MCCDKQHNARWPRQWKWNTKTNDPKKKKNEKKKNMSPEWDGISKPILHLHPPPGTKIALDRHLRMWKGKYSVRQSCRPSHSGAYSYKNVVFSGFKLLDISLFFIFAFCLFCTQLKPHYNSTYLGNKAYFIIHFGPLPFFFSLWMWSCGRWGFRCALLISQIIAIHHLFILSFRKWGHFHYCDIISCKGY